VIAIDRLRVTYGRTVALDSIDLHVRDGVTGVFGPNGAGKSTLLRAVCGLLKPAAGTVLIDGVELQRGGESLRKRIGYAGHSAGLYARLTVQENLALFARLYGAPEQRVVDVVSALGLQAWARTPAGALSAGVKRRAAVARALVHDPAVLLLDEPYAGVDDQAADLVSAALLDWRGAGRTALIATHGAKRVKSFANAGVILQRGRIVKTGMYKESVGT
jgi:heme ABC exporter ATP-binding subunit CcmA